MEDNITLKFEMLVDRAKPFHSIKNESNRNLVIFQCFYLRSGDNIYGNYTKSNYMTGEYILDGYDMVIINDIATFKFYEDAVKFLNI